MTQDQIRHLIEGRVRQDGLTETGMPGVKLFRTTRSISCVPAVYEPSVVAIASGSKEAVLDGARYVYDSSRYLLCPMSMPVKAGTPAASPETPLFGVYVALNPRVMTELSLEMENAGGAVPRASVGPGPHGIRLAHWDAAFADALLRLVQLYDNKTDSAVLADARLRGCASCTMLSSKATQASLRGRPLAPATASRGPSPMCRRT